MEFRVLGPLEVVNDGGPLSVGGPRDRALLTLLVTHVGKVVSSDRLIDALWGDDLPGDPQHALQAAVSRLRKALRVDSSDTDPLLQHAPGYLLDVEPDLVDAVRFEGLVEKARQYDDPAARVAVLTEALALWRGPALAEVAYESWAQPVIARLEAMRLDAVEDKIDGHLELGHQGEMLGRLRSLVEEYPHRERLGSQLMLALYRAGQQTEALAVYERIRKQLVEEFGVDPGPELEHTYEAILRQDDSLRWAPPDPPRTNLPERLTSFVGRMTEQSQLTQVLDDRRLVTITGPGGVGKTRLALETADAVADSYRDGCWLVDLAPVTDPSLLPRTVAAALRVPEDPLRPLVDTLVDSLRDKELLLILDNCEHMIEGSAELIERLLSSAPALKMLATSRQALGIPGETVVEVPPLTVPRPDFAGSEPSALLQYEAVRLFVDRAVEAQPGFALDRDNAAAVAQICTHLEGLPLALELAAARVRGLGVEAIAVRLGDQLGLLAGGRHARPPKERSFGAAVAWSYNLLSDPEQRVFERASVFAGSFSLEAAEVVASAKPVGGSQVADLLARLVDRSLVRRIQVAAPLESRYRMLEPLRQYARERLAARDEGDITRQRHLDFYLALAEGAEFAMRGAQQAEWLDRLAIEHDNLTAALASALDFGLPLAGFRLAGALGPYWHRRGHFMEGRQRLRLALSATTEPSPFRAKALVEAAYLAFFQCDYQEALRLSEEALDLYRRTADRWGVAYALAKFGLAAWKLGDPDRARAAFDESLRLFRDLGDGWGVATTLEHLGFMAISDGSMEEAEDAYQESLTWFRAQGDEAGVGPTLGALGRLAVLRGDLEQADEFLRRSLELTQEVGDRWGLAQALAFLGRIALSRDNDRDARELYGQAIVIFENLGVRESSAICLEGIAELASRHGDPVHAAQLFGAAETLRGLGTAFSLPNFDSDGYNHQIETLRTRLGEGPFKEAWSRGRTMTLDQARKLAVATSAVEP